MEKDHFPSTHELVTTGTNVGAVPQLVKPPPPLPPWPQYTPAGRLIGRDEIEAGEVFWRGAAYMFELLDGVHELTETALEYGWRLEAFDPRRLPSDRLLWSLRDHPDLALRIADLPRNPDESVERHAMLGFLQAFGPLSWSLLIGPVERDPNLFLASSEIARRVGDARAGAWAFNFSQPAALVRAVVNELTQDAESALVGSLRAIDKTPEDSLLRGLLVQVLNLAVAKARPRTCRGCGRLFVTTETPTEATHRTGWKRADAIYHSARCRKAHLERQRRKRQRARNTT